MTNRVKIAEFALIRKELSLASVTFYIANEDGTNSEVKATLFQAATGTAARENPQTLTEDGKLANDCYIETLVMASITGINPKTERSLQKIQQNPLEYALPYTIANLNLSSASQVTKAKAWINFNGTGTPAARSSFNVTSITDNGVGDYTINLTNPMADANGAAMGSANTVNTGGIGDRQVSATISSTSAIRVCTGQTGSATMYDVPFVSMAVFSN
jgi:hypothetical protein